MSISYGTYTADGIRVGPTFSRQTTTTPNTNASNSVFSGNNNLLAQGVLLAPWNTYNIVPATTAFPNANICQAGAVLAGNLALVQDNTVTSLVRLGNGQVVCQFDWPRTITVHNSIAVTTNIIVQGTDYYGLPLQETITLTAATTAVGQKAFWAVTSVYTSAAMPNFTGIAASTTTFGLPYRINDYSYTLAYYSGLLLTGNSVSNVVPIAGPVTLNGTTAVAVADASYLTTDILIPVYVAPNATAANLGTLIIPTAGRVAGTGFNILSTNALDTGAGASTAEVLVIRTVNNIIKLADGTSPATNTTDDVRGTITIPTPADGASRLMVYMYAQGADVWFNQQADLNIPGYPNVNTYAPLQIADLIGVPQYYTGINA